MKANAIASDIKISKRDLEVAALAVIGTVAYIHYLWSFVLKITSPILIARGIFETTYSVLSIGLAKYVRIYYPLGIASSFTGAALTVIKLHLYESEIFSIINIVFDIFSVPVCAFLFIKNMEVINWH
ncbi:hypothetical protein [Thermoplasma acidophilum]|uniref:Uncharacterized protein n=1 Tax=Thermoplasma acidophilum (strain ATCC 25905 / DSM 1728 / JCM 9062 / NBRC 15155 / AMRC-C165) TaxID=273075 RepID=Q9HIE0_THEAC|nr:hypothetical protein [Thermoplasma acidophilum]CAC12520.1 hypothetical protein [Thermoplasma acidophilum]